MSNSKAFVVNKNATYVDMIKHFLSTVVSTKKGKLLIFIWALGTAGSIGLGIGNRIYKKRLALALFKGNLNSNCSSNSTSNGNNNNSGTLARVGVWTRLSNFVKLITPIVKTAFPSKYKKQSLHFFAYSLLLALRVLLTIKVADITGRLAKAVSGRKFTNMFNTQVIFGLWCVPAAIVNSVLPYECNSMALRMREELTKSIHNVYFKDLLYYKTANLSLQSRYQALDQIITQDVKKFCYSFAEVYGNLLKPLLEIILTSIELKKRMGGRHLLGFLAFVILSAKWVTWITPPFDQFLSRGTQLEGEFRFHHARLIGASEEIALSGGSQREREIIEGSFREVLKQAKRHNQLECVQSAFEYYIVKYGSAMTAYCMLIPAMYFGTHGMDDKGARGVIQYYITCTQLFVTFGSACKALMANYKRIYMLEALALRITRLAATFAKFNSKSGTSQVEQEIRRLAERAILEKGKIEMAPSIVQEGEDIKFENVDVVSPKGQLLIRNLSFEVKKNSNVLVTGPHGSGKTALFRILAGLWPLCDGKVVKPSTTKLFYLPQRPFIVPGNLRDQITYPLCIQGTQEDERLAELLSMFDLNYLLERYGGWGSLADWADVLSIGEKQRIAMARLLFHRPTYGILDECVTSVSVDIEATLYAAARSHGITIFTVSHRPQLVQYHDYMLRLDGEGGWEWTELKTTSAE